MTQLLAHLWGDYILQSDWMAQNKTKSYWPAFVHALLYSLCFVPLCWHVAVWSYQVENVDNFFIERLWGTGARFHWVAWVVIFSTHFLIDRYRLARYVVWAKNWMGPWSHMETVGEAVERMKASGELPRPIIRPGEYFEIKPQRIRLVASLAECPTGYPPTTPAWLSTWLLIIADNTLHLTINYLALRYL